MVQLSCLVPPEVHQSLTPFFTTYPTSQNQTNVLYANVDQLKEHIHYPDILAIMPEDVYALIKERHHLSLQQEKTVLVFFEQSVEPAPFFVAPSLELEADIPLKVLCNPDQIQMSLAGIPLKVHYPVEPFNPKLQGLLFFLKK